MDDKEYIDIDREIKIHAPLKKFWHLRHLTEEQILSILYRYSEDTDKFFHNYSKFYKDIEKILTLPQEEMEKLTYIYLKSCEDFVSYIYIDTANYKHFHMNPDFVIDYNNDMGKVFDKGFINMLRSLLNKMWDGNENSISINGIDINDENINELVISKLSDQKIIINKTYLNIFLALFLKNSLGCKADELGHRGGGGSETKNISIEINDHHMRITDIPIKEFFIKTAKDARVEEFEKKHVLDGPFNFENKTIRTFYEIIKMIEYKFNCGFNSNGDFFLELDFKEQS